MDLGERKLRILRAIIDDYILTAIPVGSRTIAKKYEQQLSSATIRNEMSDLEELGYLDSPHTSAGRVPSIKAYRLYVDQLLAPLQRGWDGGAVAEQFARRFQQVQDVAENAARMLSDATQYTTVILTSKTGAGERVIRNVQLVWVSPGTALLVVALDTGEARQTVLSVGSELSVDDLYQVSRVLTKQLAGTSFSDMPQALATFAHTWHEHAGLVRAILAGVENQPGQGQTPRVVVGGSANILNYPEYNDMEKARSLLHMLETREKLTQLLVTSSPMEFVIRIGPETGMPETQDCSVVTVTYRAGRDTMNTIGVIGPTRMHYGKVLSLLRGLGDSLSGASEEETEKPPGKINK